jgi:hypothetical protein
VALDCVELDELPLDDEPPLAAFAIAAPPPTIAPVRASVSNALRSVFRTLRHLLSS